MEGQQIGNSSIYICWKMPLRKTHRYVKAQNGWAETEHHLQVFSYIMKVWEELIAPIKTTALT